MADFEDKVKAAFDAEFERNRPRPGLRGRVIANAVATPRVQRRGFGAWLTPPRLALAGTAAAVLVVAGVGLRVATQGGPPVAVKPTPTSSPSVLAFGKLPPPGLHPPLGLGAGGGSPSTVIPYFGPATMTWSGLLPKVPPAAPVYRSTVPTAADADAFAARLGATLQPSSPKEPDRIYRGPNAYQMRISLEDPVAGEPTYRIIRQSGSSPSRPFTEAAAHAAADAELTRLGLVPFWSSTVQVSRLNESGDQPLIFLVQYQRAFALGGGVVALEVDGNGDPSGIQVLVDSAGQILEITGVLRQAEEPATYPLQPPSAVVNAAVTATPAVSANPSPVPAVTLTKVTLVYTTVSANGIGYLVPAYLFTGTFELSGAQLEKRVLVPALAPRAIAASLP
ncbi:MAG TPA: hypothetical protein VHK65_01195 [Candidatus Dormibacteraeota bacterium]|nr:hypothetical protein [Candidatus Dormibacteraeota bacterium]